MTPTKAVSITTDLAAVCEDASRAALLLAEINKVNEWMREQAKGMDDIFEQLIGHCSTLFFQEEDAPIDDAEAAQHVGEIQELDRQRKELDLKMDGMMRHCFSLLSEQRPKLLECAKFDQLVVEINRLDNQQREAAKQMDQIMERVTTHCVLHFTNLLDLTFEE